MHHPETSYARFHEYDYPSEVETYYAYLNLLKNVPGESSNGFVTSASKPQSVVLQILTVLSSDCVARNSPTGSQHTPFTNPWCWSSFLSRSGEGENGFQDSYVPEVDGRRTEGISAPNENGGIQSDRRKVSVLGRPSQISDIFRDGKQNQSQHTILWTGATYHCHDLANASTVSNPPHSLHPTPILCP